jgi:fatty acid amide hydrolase
VTGNAEAAAAVLDPVAVIAAEVASGRRRAVDVLASHLARHQATHARLNALVQPRHAAAAAEAAALDAAPRGLLAGVPVSVKDCFPVRGLATSLGIPGRLAETDREDATLVVRLRDAGAVIVGKANVPQAMYLHETDNPVYGRTCHPQNPERGPGGSSGGDAALVAAGVVALGIGNDLAGSLRQPAHACGIAALMPRTAALGTGGAFDTVPQVQAVRPRAGFLARSVADLMPAAAACGIAVEAGRTSVRRVAWWDATGPIPASPAVRRGVAEAVTALRAAGVETVAVGGELAEQAAWLHLAILSAHGTSDILRLFAGDRPEPVVAMLLWLAGMPRWVRPPLATAIRLVGRRIEARGLLATGPRKPAGLTRLLAARERLAARFATLVAGCDAIVCPVSALPALRHGTAARLVLAAAPCLLANLLDLAAGAVPVTRVRPAEEAGRSSSCDPVLRAAAVADQRSAGLPVGVQVIAPLGGDEATVLEVMRLVEQAGGP